MPQGFTLADLTVQLGDGTDFAGAGHRPSGTNAPAFGSPLVRYRSIVLRSGARGARGCGATLAVGRPKWDGIRQHR
jgi:hypothetical protein